MIWDVVINNQCGEKVEILGFLDSWILGFLDSWILGFLDSWILGYFYLQNSVENQFFFISYKINLR
jgi:hypothetical protein